VAGWWLDGHSDNKANPRGLELELRLGFAKLKNYMSLPYILESVLRISVGNRMF